MTTIKSLLITIMVNHFGIQPFTEKMTNEDTRRNLSASGSRKVPSGVFWFAILAKSPSRRSVSAAIIKRMRA